MITVSVCMIVKNEEDKLSDCLDCLKDFADEIIVVDTGSTDKTKEIAAKYTDKIYDFQWIDDFAAARNYAFSKATMEYIYTADADEKLDEANIKKLLMLKKALLKEIDIVQMNYTNQLEFGTTYNYDSELRPKLFKRLREFVWQDPVHETIMVNPVVYDSDIDIIHAPHELHAKRDFSIFLKMINEGQELSKNLKTMFAKELFIAGDDDDFLSAKEYFQNQVDTGSLPEDELGQALCVLMHCARIQDDVHGLMKCSLKSVAGESCSEACNELGEYYLSKKDYNEAYMWFYNAVYETKPILSIKHGRDYPLKGLIVCCREAGNEELANEFEEKLKEIN